MIDFVQTATACEAKIGGVSFPAESIEPFGLRVTVDNALKASFQTWVLANHDELTATCNQHGFVVLDQVDLDREARVDMVEVKPDTKVTHFPHTDFFEKSNDLEREIKLLAWQLSPGKRSPTCLISDRLATEKLKTCEKTRAIFHEHITRIDRNFSGTDFGDLFRECSENLFNPNSLNIGLMFLQRLYRGLLKEYKCDQFCLMNGSKTVDRERFKIQGEFIRALDDFAPHIIRALASVTYNHDWSEQNQSALICCNSTLRDRNTVMHFAAPAKESDSAVLRRFGISGAGNIAVQSTR